MEKPKKQTKEYYDYHECRNYLQEKYGYDERDYAGRHKYWEACRIEASKKFSDESWFKTFPKDFNENQRKAHDYYNELLKSEPEYRDFWHWIVGRYDVSNGCFITFYSEALEVSSMKDWQKEIFKYYMDEFADENGELEMYVDW